MEILNSNPMDRKTAADLIRIGRKFNMDIYGFMPHLVPPTMVKQAYQKAGYTVEVRSPEYTSNLCVFYENKRIVPIKLNKNV
jgi:hypothetical protein